MIRRHWDHDRYDIVSVEKRGITTEKKLNQKTRISLLKRLRKYEWEKKERNEKNRKKKEEHNGQFDTTMEASKDPNTSLTL